MAVALLVILVMISAFTSGSETSLFSLSPMKVREFADHPNANKRKIARLLKSPLELLVTLLMINVLVNILVQNTTSHIFGTFSSWGYTVGLPLALTLVCGEIIPKTVAIANNERFATFNAPVIMSARYILGPIRIALTLFTSKMTKILFFFLKKEKTISREELKHALIAGKEQGILNTREATLMQGYINLRHKAVRSLMRPREEIIFFDLNNSLDELEKILVDQEVSRLPVCEGSLENIKGIISIRNYFLQKSKLHNSKELLPFLMPTFYVPESMPARNLLKNLDNKAKSLAIVVDEYGAITGLITQEDLIESVVGEITDRRDIKTKFTPAGKDAIIASGKLELTEFEQIFGVHLFSLNNMVTINGWLIEKLGSLPKAGDKLSEDGFFFHILATDPNRIRRIYIRKLKS